MCTSRKRSSRTHAFRPIATFPEAPCIHRVLPATGIARTCWSPRARLRARSSSCTGSRIRPYSLRHVAKRYRDDGFVAVAIRLPGHGTVPAGLTDVEWEAWSEATRIAVREARRRAGPGTPLHIVGFSNGGALAMKYALDAIADTALPRPDRLILISPMIGVTQPRALRGILRIARRAARIRQGRVARRRSRVQSVQVQLFSGQRCAAIVAPVARVAKADRRLRAAGAPRATGAGPDVPVGGGFHREHPCDRQRVLRAASGERERPPTSGD